MGRKLRRRNNILYSDSGSIAAGFLYDGIRASAVRCNS